MPRPLPSRDRDERAVRPSPERSRTFVRVGSAVLTKRGPGKVVDIVCAVGEWSEDDTRLMPPQLVIELEKPWNGAFEVTLPLQHCRLPGQGAAFKAPCRELWPDQVPDRPARVLRPTTEPRVRLSTLVSLWRSK